MGISIGPQVQDYPRRIYAPLVQLKRSWSDPWVTFPQLRFLSASRACGGAGRSQCRFAAPYGSIKQLWQTAFGVWRPLDGMWGVWVRLLFFGPAGPSVQFVGQIPAETRRPGGSSATKSGWQEFTAYGAERILERITVAKSYWLCDTDDGGLSDVREIGWVPAVNDRDDRGVIVGNRSASPDTTITDRDIYLYAGQRANAARTAWTARQYADYLLAKHVEYAGGPTWRLAGQVELLDTTPVLSAETRTVAEWLSELIRLDRGVDWFVRPTAVPADEGESEDAGGFEVVVYALSSVDWSFGGKALPKNPRSVSVAIGRTLDNVDTTIEFDGDRRYGAIRVSGKRSVVCCSLAGSDCTISAIDNTLVKGWSDAMETKYKAGAGANAVYSEDNDRVRQSDELSPVYQRFWVSPTWDPAAAMCVPKFDEFGRYVPSYDTSTLPGYQTAVLKTLDWLPLLDGVDYSVDPATDLSPSDGPPELMRPAAWLSSPVDMRESLFDTEYFYVRSDMDNVGMSVLQTQLGFQLSANPNHRMAYGWAGAAPTEHQPYFKYDRTIVTLAFESDVRPSVYRELPDHTPDAGVLEIVDDTIECWILAPDTVVGIDDDYRLKTSGAAPRELRSDHERLAEIMVGALSRYAGSRIRATISVRDFLPWSDLVGSILTTVDDGGDLQAVQSPITAISWQAGGLTTISAGFSNG